MRIAGHHVHIPPNNAPYAKLGTPQPGALIAIASVIIGTAEDTSSDVAIKRLPLELRDICFISEGDGRSTTVRGRHALSSPHRSTTPLALHPHSHIRLQPRQPSPTTYEPVRISRVPPTTLRRLSRTFAALRSPSIPFAVLRSPSIPFEILRSPSRSFDPPRSPSRSFDPSSIPFGGLCVYIAHSLRPRMIPQCLGHRPLSRRFPIAGFRTLFGPSVMLVGAVSGIGCIGMQGELDSSALTVTAPIFGLVTSGSLVK